MEQNKEAEKIDKVVPNKKRELTPQELQKRKKLIIFPIMILAFLGSMWLIFAPNSNKDVIDGTDGFNSELPLPGKDDIVSNKKEAYEQEQLRANQEERMRTLQDYGFENNLIDNIEENNSTVTSQINQPANNSSIHASANRYQDINRQLENFYEEPSHSLEMDELFERITELEMKLRERESNQSSTEDQIALLEKSYELATKYIGSNQEQTAQNLQVKEVETTFSNEKVYTVPVKAANTSIVSGLTQPISNKEFIETYSKPLNLSFNTVGDTSQNIGKNTIKACIHDNQTVMNGQSVRLRLLEALQVGNIIIPKNTHLTGIAKVQKERLDIDVESIEYNGNIFSVELTVYDTDGQKGLATPTTLERQSITEGAANIGAGLGSTFTINQNAGSAIVSDLTRGVLQGGSQYLSKKLRTAKVNLKANYQVMLFSN